MSTVKRLIKIGEASNQLGVCKQTIRSWSRQGKINFTVTVGGQRRYDIAGYLTNPPVIITPQHRLEISREKKEKYEGKGSVLYSARTQEKRSKT